MKRQPMQIPLFQIDTFTNNIFSGNPAAVCPLEEWLDDSILQSIANENNLSETAFFVKQKNGYELRWFTPTTEVDLCGHATLATAFVIFEKHKTSSNEIIFKTKSGELSVKRNNEFFVMDFPAQSPTICDPSEILFKGLGKIPIEVLSSVDYLAVFSNEEEIKNIKPNYEILKQLSLRAVIITSQSDKFDFVSRCFGPKIGINEDPVTGSAHCSLAPYWANRLNKNKLHAFQLSNRGGELFCEVANSRVFISGYAVEFLEGKINILI